MPNQERDKTNNHFLSLKVKERNKRLKSVGSTGAYWPCVFTSSASWRHVHRNSWRCTSIKKTGEKHTPGEFVSLSWIYWFGAHNNTWLPFHFVTGRSYLSVFGSSERARQSCCSNPRNSDNSNCDDDDQQQKIGWSHPLVDGGPNGLRSRHPTFAQSGSESRTR